MKKLLIVLFSILVISVPAFSIGPIPVTLYGGPYLGAGAGSNVGINAILALPIIPNLGIEYETFNAPVKTDAGNVSIGGKRTGLMYKMGLILFSVVLSAGEETITPSDVLTIADSAFGDKVFVGNYVSLGLDFEISSFVINPKVTSSTFKEGPMPSGSINVGYRF